MCERVKLNNEPNNRTDSIRWFTKVTVHVLYTYTTAWMPEEWSSTQASSQHLFALRTQPQNRTPIANINKL